MEQFISVAIAVVEHRQQFLVGRRAEHLPLGGLWEFPGGKLEENESPQQAAERECLEETGLAVTATRCLVVNLQQYQHGHIKLHFYACHLKTPARDDSWQRPRPPYQWVSRDTLQQLAFPVGNRPLLEQLRDQ